ncbi:hypothetical protein TGRUB_429940 [Toxoplasma gondii RUB]|uniref:Uncharacterized protein n=1 Tax=Toxoplasma gondii RUB TaxID=935652 RepID=A0A086M3W5_TOXGO|nr:hypothetical protein TGRUB_429940 [Toxoplasma gondii RUB]
MPRRLWPIPRVVGDLAPTCISTYSQVCASRFLRVLCSLKSASWKTNLEKVRERRLAMRVFVCLLMLSKPPNKAFSVVVSWTQKNEKQFSQTAQPSQRYLHARVAPVMS